MKLLSIVRYKGPSKKLYTAKFEMGDGTTRTTHFGSQGASFIDHGDVQKRHAYIARHTVNEDWSDPRSAGALSRYILWEKKSLNDATRAYKERFNL